MALRPPDYPLKIPPPPLMADVHLKKRTNVAIPVTDKLLKLLANDENQAPAVPSEADAAATVDYVASGDLTMLLESELKIQASD